MRRAWLAAAALVATMAATPGRAASPALPDPLDDEAATRATVQALHAAILGDAHRARAVAQSRATREEAARELGADPPRLAGTMAVLAAVSGRETPTLAEYRADMRGFDKGWRYRAMDRMLRGVGSRQRFLEATADRRFERIRRIYNSFAVPLAGVVTGQFLDLLILPFEGIEQALVGGRYLTPEERRELFTARSAASAGGDDPAGTRAREAIGRLTVRRERLAALQARRNGDRAAAEGLPATADFWFRREMAVTGRSEPFRDAHRDVLEDRAARDVARNASNQVARRDVGESNSAEFAEYAVLLRRVVREPAAPATGARARSFHAEHPTSPAAAAAIAAEAANAMASGEPGRAAELLDGLRADPAWGPRAEAALADARILPVPGLEAGKARSTRRFRDFITLGELPRGRTESLVPEDARLIESGWIRAARSAFVLDMVSRLLISPFLDPMPAEELFDAAGRVPAAWWEGGEGRAWRSRIARALEDRRRFMEARDVYASLGDEAGVARTEQRAARDLERRADDEPDAEVRARLLRRASAFPAYRNSARVERKLARAQREANGFLRIPRALLRAHPDIAGELAVGTSGAAMTEKGVLLLRGGGAIFESPDGTLGERQLSEKVTLEIANRALPLLRDGIAIEQTGKPLPRRRIPLALEGGAFPGFDVMPGLVPLSPDPRLRKLYE